MPIFPHEMPDAPPPPPDAALDPAAPIGPVVDGAGGTTRRYDVAFAVPFTHRVRFTADVLGADAPALLDVLHADGRPARVLFLLDAGVAAGAPGLPGRLLDFADRHRDRIALAGPVALVPGGERCKNDPAVLDDLLSRFNALDLDRRNYVVAVGGGAVLDAVGFAAAVAHRGIRLVRLPSTTLAQDDSGIGVKNAVNLFGKKNWKGSFAVPWAVVNDAKLLETLPDRDFRCGFSEAVKVSLLKEPAFFDRLCATATDIAARDPAASSYAIERSAYWHLRHIARGGDPFETREARPLDFGHWSAHKLEGMTDFRLRHGEAVGIGLAIDCAYSSMVHGLSDADARRVTDCLRDLRLPLSHPAVSRADELLDGLEEFRQHLGGRLTITMLDAPGRPIDVHEVDAGAMREAIASVRESSADAGGDGAVVAAGRGSDGAVPGNGRPVVNPAGNGRAERTPPTPAGRRVAT